MSVIAVTLSQCQPVPLRAACMYHQWVVVPWACCSTDHYKDTSHIKVTFSRGTALLPSRSPFRHILKTPKPLSLPVWVCTTGSPCALGQQSCSHLMGGQRVPQNCSCFLAQGLTKLWHVSLTSNVACRLLPTSGDPSWPSSAAWQPSTKARSMCSASDTSQWGREGRKLTWNIHRRCRCPLPVPRSLGFQHLKKTLSTAFPVESA